MKKLVLFSMLCCSLLSFSQDYYKQQWDKIRQNTEKGVVKSNESIIQEIKTRAMKEKNVPQLIKALKNEFSVSFYKNDDEQNNEKSGFLKQLQDTEKSLKGDDQVFFSVLVMEYVKDYYLDNSWRINMLTNLDQNGKGEIETWTKLDFKNWIAQKIESIDTQSNKLKNIQITQYQTIFEENDLEIDFVKSAYDWYQLNKIDYWKSDLFTKDEKVVNNEKVQATYKDLIERNEGNSKLYFQEQLLNDQLGNKTNKEVLTELSKIYESNTQGDYKAVIANRMMQLLIDDGKQIEALAIADQAKAQYKKSKFINGLLNTESTVRQSTLGLFFENQTLPNMPIHLVADAKNVDRFSLEIFEVLNPIDFRNYINDQYNYPFSKLKKTLVRKEDFKVDNKGDYKNYKTSFEIKGLPSGLYVVQYNVNGKGKENIYFIVSNISIVNISKELPKPLKRLVNSNTGKPIASQDLVIYDTEKSKLSSGGSIKSDKNGDFTYPTNEINRYYNNYFVNLKGTKDYTFDQFYRDRGATNDVMSKSFSQIFLDRKIYRPSQLVYFKVVTKKSQGESTVLATNENLEIVMLDANQQEVSKQKFTTNEFGSFSGSFSIPLGQLNGTFSLRVNSNSLYTTETFRVEEYKRPKFEITFDPIKEEYKYGQIVELKGKAMMFSGVPLGNSTVQYEIKKQNISWRYFSWFPRRSDNENSILGETKTDEKGEFVIKVKLEKDDDVKGIQVNNYQVNASVTDINGETQFSETSVKVASVSHYLEMSTINDALTTDAIETTITAKNYNGQSLPKPYQLKLVKLQEPDRVLRSNFENAVQNNPQLSYTDFIQKFPHDSYSKDDLIGNWKEVKAIKNWNNHSETKINFGKLEPGRYRAIAFNIENQDTIQVKKDFSIWSPKELAKDQKPFLHVVQAKTTYKRGEIANFYLYSAIPDAVVNVFIQDGRGKLVKETQTLKNGFLAYNVHVPQSDQIEVLNVQFQIVAFNDIQTKNMNIEIEETKKPLRIETVTFRDKLEPNQKEKWAVKILGDDKEKINAELLASMYDQSLDQFAPNTWSWRKYSYPTTYQTYDIDRFLKSDYFQEEREYHQERYLRLPQFSWLDNNMYGGYSTRRMSRNMAVDSAIALEEVVVVGYGNQRKNSKISKNVPPPPPAASKAVALENAVAADAPGEQMSEDLGKIPVRENLNETAFFYPNLLTDKDGNVHFEFVSPEALTKWKLMFLAHTKDARAAILEKEVVTQKEFSITPNYPRFLREGDEILFQTKISSLVDKKLSGFAQLQIIDALTNQDISASFNSNDIKKEFSLNENGNTVAKWTIKVPHNVSSVILKVVAKAGNYSDGEQKAVAVLPNRMLVTDALPIFVKEGQTKTFVLDALKNNNSKSLSNVSNTLELTTNPIWEVMFALPSLKEDQDKSADVVFNRWFADVLASEIFKANPRMKAVFDEYQSKGLLTSNLEKNQELKALLLEETPWVLDSKDEKEQMQKLARIFDANTMRNSLHNDWSDLMKLQNSDGGFSWYQGYPSSYFVSIYILKNLGRINNWLKEGAKDYQSEDQKLLVSKLIQYVDNEVGRYWEPKKDFGWSNFTLDYLDSRQYWDKEYPLKGTGVSLKREVIANAKKANIKDFTFFGLHRAALLFNHYGLKDVSNKLMTYLKETSTVSEKQGTYWKQNLNDWGWYNTNFINHAGALEAFQTLKPKDETFIEDMKVWLMTQKEVNSWGTSRGTAEVIFTILNSGKSWTTPESDQAKISWGNKELAPQTFATGYVKQAIVNSEVNKDLSTVTIQKTSPGIVQGGVFWQYYEDLDKIKSSENYISVTKELYKKVKTVNGEELKPITSATPLKIGDKVTVRMILNTDRSMEFVHLKDMRASGFEPIDVLSGYQWKNGLGYYQSTKDASTNFYIEYMPKGKYVFEYDFVANAAGSFSNGITTLQNYYAPQMNSHTKGTRVVITE